MYIIVVGGGEVGYYLTKTLLSDGHEVLLLESATARSQRLVEEFGSIVIRGDGCEAATLESVGTGRADMLIAVTSDDEDNLVSCQVAKHKFGVPRTIARIKNPGNEKIFKLLGIDTTVNTTSIILAHIESELPYHPLIPLLKLRRGGLEVVEVKVQPGSSIAGKRLGDLKLPPETMISLIAKEKGPQLPTKDTILEAGDEIVAVARTDYEEELRIVLTAK